jgi:hypothetical protein
MGYTTDFEGKFKLSRPLTVKEFNILKAFSEERHGDNLNIYPGFPGFHCDWVPTENGEGIEWNGAEKFYDYEKWLQLIINKYLTPWGIKISGKVEYQGEGMGDHGTLSVVKGKVKKSGCRK